MQTGVGGKKLNFVTKFVKHNTKQCVLGSLGFENFLTVQICQVWSSITNLDQKSNFVIEYLITL